MKFRISLISILLFILIGVTHVDVAASEIKSDYKIEQDKQTKQEATVRYETNQTQKKSIKFDTRKPVLEQQIAPIIQEKPRINMKKWINGTGIKMFNTAENLGKWAFDQSKHVVTAFQNKIKHDKDTLEGWITFFKDVTTNKSTPRNTEQIQEEALGQVYSRFYEWSSPTYATTQLNNQCITKRNVLFSAVQKQMDETTRKQTYF